MSVPQKNNLFPTLGEVASHIEALPDVDDNDARLKEDRPAMAEQEEGEEKAMQEIESLCMRCHEQGTTRMLLTSIPYFKEIVVSSFRCDNCGHRDTEIQSAGEIQVKGCTYTVHLLSRNDLNRQLVKSNWATVTLPEFQLTIPPGRGQLTTVEGLIRDTVRDLNIGQHVRRIMDPDAAGKIDIMLGQLRDVLGIEEGEEEEDGGVGYDREDRPRRTVEEIEAGKASKVFKPFSVSLDDPSGNSFFQFHEAPSDPQWNMRAYNRTFEQNVELGLVARPDEMVDDKTHGAKKMIAEDHRLGSADEVVSRLAAAHANSTGQQLELDGVVPEEIFSFPGTCSSCGHQLETLMQQVNIPYFKNIIIMSANCYSCGYRDNEIKTGGAVSVLGKRIVLRVEDEEDLSRDLLKSDTCGLEIPEIDLILQPGTLGGRFTTLEGILNEIYTELSTKVFRTGDSATSGIGQIHRDPDANGERKFEDFLQGLKDCMAATKPFTLILDDPVSNSYLQNLYAPDPDPNMEITEYERTHEQNEELGLNDMVLEGYEQGEAGKAGVEEAKVEVA